MPVCLFYLWIQKSIDSSYNMLGSDHHLDEILRGEDQSAQNISGSFVILFYFAEIAWSNLREKKCLFAIFCSPETDTETSRIKIMSDTQN